ncbi:MAG: hypothetical protein WKF92_11910 [Pyrinomonadaceae bacterium]
MRNAKFILLAGIVIVVFTSALFAQTEKQIAAIRAEVQAINKGAAKYTKKTKNLYDLSTEGAEVTFYTSGKGLKKIVAKIYGESGNNTNEYFYQGKDLIFVLKRQIITTNRSAYIFAESRQSRRKTSVFRRRQMHPVAQRKENNKTGHNQIRRTNLRYRRNRRYDQGRV